MDFLGIHLFYRWREVGLPTEEDDQGGGVIIQGTDMMFRNPLEENVRVTVNAVTGQGKHSIGIGHLITMSVTVSTVTITEDTVINHQITTEAMKPDVIEIGRLISM